MPELGEVTIFSKIVNEAGKNYNFKSISNLSKKNPDIPVTWKEFGIRSESRGKELVIIVFRLGAGEAEEIRVLVNLSMTGIFCFNKTTEPPKYVKLQFITSCTTHSLFFSDQKGWGVWHIAEKGELWSDNRGPDPLTEYDLFRKNVLSNLKAKQFNNCICEALLEQLYFNGIGNYLRAEILFRAGINPFLPARDVLQAIADTEGEEGAKGEDILDLCRSVPQEVVTLGINKYAEDNKKWADWCQCYDKPGMTATKDKNGRMIYHKPEFISVVKSKKVASSSTETSPSKRKKKS
ncbi:Endonuclease 8-like 1 [Oopsacas minuta]|uniref:DNA-(apurinic or apyrimidinic site) lyase n=1 Tax=Oopsacas minuta TaxID=111878 RepID=A0AAV7JBC6_9METZ|nr:Endonuclease 8-like 1 [Oopsacas minuta]